MSLNSEHPLLKHAFVYSPGRGPTDPAGARYDIAKGFWIVLENGQDIPLVYSTDPKRPQPSTKKADRETGEDQKGA